MHCHRSTSHNRRVPSSPPLSRWRLSGVKASPHTSAVWPCSAPRDVVSFASHNRIVWPELLLASVAPSGLQVTQCIFSPVCSTSVWHERRRPSSPRSHSLTLPSQLALARVRPLGAKASPCTQLRCPSSVCTQDALPWDGISHNRIAPVSSSLASRCPSGLQASAETG